MYRRRCLPNTMILFLLLCLPAMAQEKLLTINDIFDPATRVRFDGDPPNILRWLKDGTHYLQNKVDRKAGTSVLLRVDAASGEATPLFDAGKMQAALAKLPGMRREDARELAHQDDYSMNQDETVVLLNHDHNLISYRLGSDTAVKLTDSPEEKVGEEFSPDGRLVSYIRNNNIYVVEVTGGRERALTTDGTPKLLNGRLDWVYQEEVYGRGNFKGYWWSPDSTRLAYLQIDEAPVHEFAVVDHIPHLQKVEETPYPEAGDPNPTARLGVVGLADGVTKWIGLETYQPADLLLVRAGWTPDSKSVCYQAQNREQTWLDLNFADPVTGESRTLLREQTKAWVDAIDNPTWLKDGSFLWLSERSGWKHLYHYARDGKLLRQVTDGKWEVRTLHGVDQSKGIVYFSGTEHSPVGSDAYRVGLDGSGLTRLTKTDGTHRANFNADLTRYVDYWSDAQTPTQVRLCDNNGALVRTIDENRVAALKQYKLGQVELMQVKTRDGFLMEAMMIKPPDFDPHKRYPVWSYTYSGPHTQNVRNAWGGATYMWHQLLAEKGYLIWICDNRTASGKGAESTWPVYGNFGELELRDLEDGLGWLRGQPYVDGSRIGLWGWSFGGFMTTYALTHSTTFKIGIAGGSVTDWRNYDSIYTERYMKTPQHNPAGYERSAPLDAAQNLHGKLFLIHGAMDDNVHVQNTIQLLYNLQKADKQVQLMLYPKSRHGVADPLLVRHMREMMTDYILANL